MNPEEKTRVFSRLTDHLKYLYEREVERAIKLDSAARNYFLFLTTTIAGAITVAGWFIKDRKDMPTLLPVIPLPALLLFALAGVALLAAFGFVLATWQIRHFARLGNPNRLAQAVSEAPNEIDALEYIAADFVAAADIDYGVNQRKARWLYFCFPVYLFALLSLFSGALIIILAQA